MRSGRLIALATVVFTSSLVLSQCSRQAPPPAPAAAPASNVQAVVSVHELMTQIFDPIGDVIFNAVGSEATEKGIVDIRPTTDEDWARVMSAAVTIAEGTNLLKIHPRPIVPADYKYEPWLRGDDKAPELTPERVQERVNAQRGVWDSYADALRAEGLKVVDIVKAKDADKLFQAAYEMNVVCERCHLTFWIPGDVPAVEADAQKKATTAAPRP